MYTLEQHDPAIKNYTGIERSVQTSPSATSWGEAQSLVQNSSLEHAGFETAFNIIYNSLIENMEATFEPNSDDDNKDETSIRGPRTEISACMTVEDGGRIYWQGETEGIRINESGPPWMRGNIASRPNLHRRNGITFVECRPYDNVHGVVGGMPAVVKDRPCKCGIEGRASSGDEAGCGAIVGCWNLVRRRKWEGGRSVSDEKAGKKGEKKNEEYTSKASNVRNKVLEHGNRNNKERFMR
ncbi:uncharacterized protein EV420DRAFT_1483772 [Desarmillaria tabescens]|uniref:Uncharacterized protein n=1 Tax=Armillaria tabescens TaxID=1929756 RepID=A0AA39JRH6_ARMTA|nr:uncharacterized protein EV420DRAFT_1483772 [Desarmillaria tabescens]KAK0447404.1 hypothetical protein EV420DRAFT_1483772 [Desarmillaria tabescens]